MFICHFCLLSTRGLVVSAGVVRRYGSSGIKISHRGMGKVLAVVAPVAAFSQRHVRQMTARGDACTFLLDGRHCAWDPGAR